jgi:iron complex outermembrane receptor protein
MSFQKEFSVLRLMVLSVLLVSVHLFAQTISGTVVDVESQRPITNANVMVLNTSLGAVTDREGKFEIRLPKAGAYDIQVTFIGFEKNEKSVNVDMSGTALEISLKPSPIEVEEITISANAETPDLGMLLISDQLSQKNPADVGAFFRDVIGAGSIKKGAAAQDPVIRGFKYNQLNVMFDGGLGVTGGCPSRMDPPTSHVQAEDIDRIEIIKGPFSSRYPQTMGGIVNMVTHNARSYGEDGFRVGLISGYESVYGGSRGRVFITGGNTRFDYYAGGGTKQYGDYRDGSGETVPSQFKSNDYSVKLGYQPSQHQRLQLSWRQSFARDTLYPALPMDATIDDTDMLSVDYSYKNISPLFASLSAKVYSTWVDHEMDNANKPTAANTRAVTTAQTQTVGYRLEALLNAQKTGLFYVGTDFTHLNMNGDRTRTMLQGAMAGKNFVDAVWPDANHQTIGLFTEWHKTFSPQWRAVGGLRADLFQANAGTLDALFSSTYGTFDDKQEVNPGANIRFIFEPKSNIEFALGVGHGARSASITELYINRLSVGLDRYEYFGNPLLDAEKNTQLEVSHRARFGKFSYDVTGFYSDLSDYISAVVNPDIPMLIPAMANGVKQFINIKNAYKYGGEMSTRFDLSSQLFVKAAGAYTLGQNADMDEPLPEMPPLESRLYLRYTHLSTRFFIEANARFANEQTRVARSFAETKTPGFSIYNLMAGFKVGRIADITMGMDNIFDTAYSEHLTRRYKFSGLPIYEPGRNFYVNLKITN